MPGGRGKRGGYQEPKHPAAVSGPGAMSARTDGRGGAKPPLPTGQPYGQRQALQEFQASGPMRPEPPAGAGGPPVQPAPAATPLDPFAPTQRPDEPITAGAPIGPGPNGGILPRDVDSWLRDAYVATNGHPAIAELLQDMAGEA